MWTGACTVQILHGPQNRECQVFSSVFLDVSGKSAHHEQASKSGVRLFITLIRQRLFFQQRLKVLLLAFSKGRRSMGKGWNGGKGRFFQLPP